MVPLSISGSISSEVLAMYISKAEGQTSEWEHGKDEWEEGEASRREVGGD